MGIRRSFIASTFRFLFKLSGSRANQCSLFLDMASEYASYITIINDKNNKFTVSTKDKVIGFSVLATGDFEPEYRLRALSILEQANYKIQENSCFVEVGANIGTTSVPMMRSDLFSQGLLIEAHPDNVELLKCNSIQNGILDFSHIVCCAATEVSCSLNLAVDPENEGHHHISNDKSAKTITVPGLPLDSILEKYNINPERVGLVWIDVEGHEFEVLSGSSQLLKKSPPLIMEFTPESLGTEKVLEIHKLIHDNYTHVFDVRENKRIFSITDLAKDLLSNNKKINFTDIIAFKAV